MTPKKILFMVLALLLSSTPCFAEDGYVRAEVGPASMRLVYVQTVNAITQNLHVRVDVTNKIPHEIEAVSNNTILIVD